MPVSYNTESWRKPAFLILPQIRQMIKISQTDLGNKVGLSRQSISVVERGYVPLSWSVFLAFMLVVLTNKPDAFDILDNQEIIHKVVESLKTNS